MLTRTNSKAIVQNETLQILLAVGLLFCCGQIAIPLKPVPITLQTVAVLLIGLFYTQKQAIRSILAYLFLGAIGVPLFANFSSLLSGSILGKGYLIGFVAAAFVMPLFRECVKKENSWTILLNCFLGSCCIYVFGVSWLALFLGPEKAIHVGLLPFLIPGCFKALLLSQAVHFIKKKSEDCF